MKIELEWLAHGEERLHERAPRRLWLAWAVAAVALIVAAIAGLRREDVPQSEITRLTILPPENTTLTIGESPVLSPDGRQIVFSTTDASGGRLLRVRALDALESRLLSGTEGASLPFWSPDSRFVAFFSGGSLKKVGIDGGPPSSSAMHRMAGAAHGTRMM